jgi:chromosome segregation ATPase
VVEIDHRVRAVEAKIVNLEASVEEQEAWLQEPEELRESWLEKNVAAEGEVAVLRERVDRQDRTIQRLERQVQRALDLIRELNPGKSLRLFFIPGTDFF